MIEMCNDNGLSLFKLSRLNGWLLAAVLIMYYKLTNIIYCNCNIKMKGVLCFNEGEILIYSL